MKETTKNIISSATVTIVAAFLGAFVAGMFAASISGQDREQRLKMAALDKRLEVHQEAYTIWWNATKYLDSTRSSGLAQDMLMIGSGIDTDSRWKRMIETQEMTRDAQKWLGENAVYLSESVAYRFWLFTWAMNSFAMDYEQYVYARIVDSTSTETKEAEEKYVDTLNMILAPGEAILKTTALPNIKDGIDDNWRYSYLKPQPDLLHSLPHKTRAPLSVFQAPPGD